MQTFDMKRHILQHQTNQQAPPPLGGGAKGSQSKAWLGVHQARCLALASDRPSCSLHRLPKCESSGETYQNTPAVITNCRRMRAFH